MRIFRGLLITAILAALLLFGGPIIAIWVFSVPVLFLVAVVGLAAWKIGDLVRRA